MIVNPCSDTLTQQWKLEWGSVAAQFRIKNGAAGECLKATVGDDKESYQLSFATCANEVDQQWSYLD